MALNRILPVSEQVGERLDLLTKVACLLGVGDVSSSSYATCISRLSSSELALKRSINRLEFIENELRGHLASVKHEERLIEGWTEIIHSDQQTGDSVVTLERRRDGLLRTAEDYRKELDNLEANFPEPIVTVTDLVAHQERIREREQVVKSKRTKIKAFQGLPPNLDVARHELRNARNEQMKLIQLRERLLAKMADGVV